MDLLFLLSVCNRTFAERLLDWLVGGSRTFRSGADASFHGLEQTSTDIVSH